MAHRHNNIVLVSSIPFYRLNGPTIEWEKQTTTYPDYGRKCDNIFYDKKFKLTIKVNIINLYIKKRYILYLCIPLVTPIKIFIYYVVFLSGDNTKKVNIIEYWVKWVEV